MILTWLTQKCRRHPYPLYFLKDLVELFDKRKDYFKEKYQNAPVFKASVHSGRVIATEVGNFGSAIAYHGDILNSTARIQSLCNLLKKDFVVSDTFLKKMPHTHGFKVQAHGSFQMRGKDQDLDVYSLN